MMLSLLRLADAPFHAEPFEYLIVDDILSPDGKRAIQDDFPVVNGPGSFPLSALKYGTPFGQLVSELLSKDFELAVGRKFSIDLSRYATLVTVRGQCSAKADGHIHTDSKDKIITVLLYLNASWESEGGRLRLLRSKNLDDYAAEVSPTMGNLVVFRRSNCSWHGHKPFEGPRVSLQMNWLSSARYMRREHFRHELSSLAKRMFGKADAR